MDTLEVAPVPKIDFPVIGIGASAGGLEAVTTMFNKVHPDLGLAYVLVMHLDPNHESLMVELLSRKTQVEVRQIADGDEVQINCLHVIPPGYGLTLEGKTFKLEKFEEPRGLRRPIDSFFTSMAGVQGEKCACVVLSGTGADGTAGLRIGKDLGGVIAVQTPEEARYDGMPFSAIATNLIDFTLPADEIIPRLRSYFDGHGDPDWSSLQASASAQKAVSSVFGILQETHGNDFSGYKPSMLLRRMKRRMQVHGIIEFEAYVEMLEVDEGERAALAQDFLINVTSFFRDWEKFELLRKTVLVPLINDKSPSDEVRIWVPGCSSGQEAFTFAMMVDNTCQELKKKPLVQIFATDIDEEMLARARLGEYLFSELADLPKEYRDSYTVSFDGHFEVSAKIRNMVRFSHHNIIQDPPFSKIDLISCRNLLIYLGEDLQTELFPVLHFSLRPGGHLFLGSSENVSRQNDLFTVVDQSARVFRRLDVAKRVTLNMPLGRVGRIRQAAQVQQRMAEHRDFPEFASIGASNEEVYQEYAPPFVRVTGDGKVIGSSGDLGMFLLARPGEERDLYTLLREGVRDIAMSLLGDTAKGGSRMAVEDVEVYSSFGTVKTDIVSHPMRDGTFAIVFVVQELLKPTIKKYTVAPASTDKRVSDLQEQLSRAQILLKGKVEEVETANEELKSSNEEMMSMNEELQSANEELTTANEELKNKIDELSLANADLDNFMNSADLAMIVLDRSLRIRHLTGATSKALPIKKSDIGRFLVEFNLGFGTIDLPHEIQEVMRTKTPFTLTTEPDENGNSFLVQITPFYFRDDVVDGATITLTDITTEVALRYELGVKTNRMHLAMQVGRMGLAEMDVETGMVTVDDVLGQHLNLNKVGAITLDELTTNLVEDDVSLVKDSLQQAIDRNEDYEFDFRVRRDDDSIGWVRTRGTSYRGLDGKNKVVGPTLDVTDVINKTAQRELLIREMSHRVKNLFAVIGSMIQVAPQGYDDTEQMAGGLMGKVAALGRVYDLARKKTSLEGVDMEGLFQSVIDPHVTTQRIKLDGPPCKVKGNALHTLTLITHELTTNAYKHGALAKPEGTVNLTWEAASQRRFNFTWTETVPGFQATDNEDGFGTSLLKGATAQLNGSFERTYTEKGAKVTFTVDLSGEH